MEFFKYTKSFNFMGKSKKAMYLSILLVIMSYVLVFTKGINYGVDFTGGTLIQVKYDKVAPIKNIREKLKTNKLFKNATIVEFGSPEEIVIRMKTTTSDISVDIGDLTRESLKDTGKFDVRRVDIIGPTVGAELKEKGIMSLLLATFGILIYVAFRFEWRFAVASIFALIHDISLAIGAITLVQLEVNLDVLAALLTILGYSLNDTIIVFDRIREGIVKTKKTDFFSIINESITKTLSRTTLTSLTTFFVVFTLFMFGGEIIHPFAFTLLIGIVVGTYSSIFIASPTLIYFGFNVREYNTKLADKAKRAAEKDRMRSQFETGVL